MQNTEVMSNEPFFLSEQKTTPVKIFYVAQESGEWGRSQHELVLIEVYSCGQIIVQNLVIVITMWRTSQYVKKKKREKKSSFFQIPAKFSEHSLFSVMSFENHISASF